MWCRAGAYHVCGAKLLLQDMLYLPIRLARTLQPERLARERFDASMQNLLNPPLEAHTRQRVRDLARTDHKVRERWWEDGYCGVQDCGCHPPGGSGPLARAAMPHPGDRGPFLAPTRETEAIVEVTSRRTGLWMPITPPTAKSGCRAARLAMAPGPRPWAEGAARAQGRWLGPGARADDVGWCCGQQLRGAPGRRD